VNAPPGPACPPSWRAEVEQVRGGSEDDFARTHDLSLDEYRRQARQRIIELVDRKQLRIRMLEGQLATFIAERRFKNYFEGGETTGVKDKGLRRKVESRTLGVSESAQGEDRPIYGYLQGSLENHHELKPHGSIIVVLKPEVTERATIVFGDTIGSTNDAELAVFAPDDLRQPTLLCSYAYRDPLLAAVLGDAVDPVFGFAELQIYGGISDHDIAYIFFCKGEEPDETTMTHLEQAEIRYRLQSDYPA